MEGESSSCLFYLIPMCTPNVHLEVLSSLLKLQIGSFQYETAAPKSRIPSLLSRRNHSKAVSSLFLERCYNFKVSARPIFPDRDVGSHLAFCWRQVADALHSADKRRSDRASCSSRTHVWQLQVTVICLSAYGTGQYRKWQANSVTTTLIHLLPRTPVIITDISLCCILSEVSLTLTLDQNSEVLFRIPGISVSKGSTGIETAYKPRVTPSESLPGLPRLPVIIVSYSSGIYNYSLVGFKHHYHLRHNHNYSLSHNTFSSA